MNRRTNPRRPSIWEPVADLRRVPIHECGEPLVNFLTLCHNPRLRRDRPRYRYRYETLLRQSVAEKLCLATTQLSEGLCLSVIEGWRAPQIQARMYRATWDWWQERHPDWSEATLRRIVNRYTAPVNDNGAPPPHTTGGAIDLFLTDANGNALDVCAPFDAFDPRSYPFDAPGLSPIATENRQTLKTALESVGITNYPGEYWHWSYGDQGWAYRGNHPNALYGLVLPPDWTPDPQDISDAPLEALP